MSFRNKAKNIFHFRNIKNGCYFSDEIKQENEVASPSRSTEVQSPDNGANASRNVEEKSDDDAIGHSLSLSNFSNCSSMNLEMSSATARAMLPILMELEREEAEVQRNAENPN